MRSPKSTPKARKRDSDQKPLNSSEAYREAIVRVARVRKQHKTTLNLSDLNNLRRLPPLNGLSRLRSIKIDYTKIRDLSELRKLEMLSHLSFRESDVVDLSPIGALKNLKEINGTQTDIRDLSIISNLSKLTELAIGGTKITKLDGIENLQRLKTLFVWETGLKNISLLTRLPHLSALSLMRTNVSDFSPISKCIKLKRLLLDGSNIYDLSPLAPLRELEQLSLSDTKTKDLSSISTLKELRRLDVDRTQVTDPSPLADLLKLSYLNCSNTKVADISSLSNSLMLRSLILDGSLVSDLSPAAELSQLVVGANIDSFEGGLSYARCPIPDPILEGLSTRENPQRTTEAIAYLRRQEGLPALPDDFGKRKTQKRLPPGVPQQGPGPHFVLRDDGLIDFAPPESIDKYGNNIGRLRSLHPTLRELARHLGEALSRGNVAHANLNERVQSYLDLVDRDLEEVPFDRLYVEGVRLQNATIAANEKIAEKELPSFDASVRESLESVLALHGTFMMSTSVGLEMISAEERYQRRPEEERELRAATKEFAEELQSRGDIMTANAASFVLKAADEIGAGANRERSTVVATATTKNAAIVVMSGASIGALPLVGGALAGPAGLVGGGLIALIGVEGLKKSKAFLAMAGLVTEGLDQLKELDLQTAVTKRAQSLAPYVGFVLKIEPTLRRLGKQPQFSWLNASLNWLRANTTQQGPRIENM
jgi:hypothetical protein